MDIEKERKLQYFYAKLAGLSYIIFTVAGLVKNFLLNTKLSNTSVNEVSSIFENEMHFRLGVLAETIMLIGVILASVSFYVVLKSVSKQLAKTAVFAR